MTGIDGNTVFAPYLRSYFEGIVPGSILLFRYNIASSPESVFRFLQSCNKSFAELGTPVPVLFAIDHEGGKVYRTGSSTTYLPAATDVASLYSMDEAWELYRLSGIQLFTMGIRMNLAPVVEILTDENRPFLSTRAYSSDPNTVADYAESAIRGFQAGGILSAIKHFPGNTDTDPHAGIPVLNVSAERFDSDYVEPFRRVLSVSPDAILVSHCIVSAIDPDIPFCLSKKGVTGIIRESLGFSGLVITDDISMEALTKAGFSSSDAAVYAIRAGCDSIMTSGTDIRQIVTRIVDTAETDANFAQRLDSAVLRILRAKYRVGLIQTAQQQYAASRLGNQSAFQDVFDETMYWNARRDCDELMERKHDTK